MWQFGVSLHLVHAWRTEHLLFTALAGKSAALIRSFAVSAGAANSVPEKMVFFTHCMIKTWIEVKQIVDMGCRATEVGSPCLNMHACAAAKVDWARRPRFSNLGARAWEALSILTALG